MRSKTKSPYNWRILVNNLLQTTRLRKNIKSQVRTAQEITRFPLMMFIQLKGKNSMRGDQFMSRVLAVLDELNAMSFQTM
jgi:hypothetical protein